LRTELRHEIELLKQKIATFESGKYTDDVRACVYESLNVGIHNVAPIFRCVHIAHKSVSHLPGYGLFNMWSSFTHPGCDWSAVPPATLPCMARYMKTIATRLSHIDKNCTRATLLQFKMLLPSVTKMVTVRK